MKPTNEFRWRRSGGNSSCYEENEIVPNHCGYGSLILEQKWLKRVYDHREVWVIGEEWIPVPIVTEDA